MDEQNKEQDTGYRTDTTVQEEGVECSSQETEMEMPAGDGEDGRALTEDAPEQMDGQDAPQPQGQAEDGQQNAPWQQGPANGGWQNAPAPGQQAPANGWWQNTPVPGQQGPVNGGWQNAPAPGQQAPVNGGWQNAPAPGQQAPANGGWQPWNGSEQQQGPYPQGGIYQPPYQQNMPQRDLYGQGMPPQGPQRNFYDPNGQQPQQRPPMNNMAVTSMVLGIASILLSCCCFPVGFIISFALGMGGLALAIISKKGQPFSGFAIAGLVLSILGICGSLFIFGCYMLTAQMMKDPEYSALFNEIFQQYYNGN